MLFEQAPVLGPDGRLDPLEVGLDVVGDARGAFNIVGIGSRQRGKPLIDSLQSAARLRGSGKFQDDFTLIAIQDSE